MSALTNAQKAAALRIVADDEKMMWEVGRFAIEETLIEFRDSGLGIMGRGNGLVVRYADGSSSDIMRMTTEGALRIGMLAMAEHLETLESGE